MSDVLTVAGIADAVRRMHAGAASIRDELNAADRLLGDGDTGMTIAAVVSAWHDALATVPADVATLLRELARETRRASGSSLGSVLAIGLVAAAKQAAMHTSADREAVVAMLDAAVAAIAERSGAAPGDKTVLDALLAVRDALARASDEHALLDVAIQALTEALAAFRSREARIGRARMYGAKSIGHDDPGMLAALLLLRGAAS
jgi:phosphoenolpyruvate---glycerone phosphotransferase subunit DhaL